MTYVRCIEIARQFGYPVNPHDQRFWFYYDIVEQGQQHGIYPSQNVFEERLTDAMKSAGFEPGQPIKPFTI
jgi:hypothetical protein